MGIRSVFKNMGRYAGLAVATWAMTVTAASAAARTTDSPPLNVVASFSVLADMVEVIGGNYVAVTTLVGPGGDAHSFEPSPHHAQALAQADVLFVNGMNFEAWLPRLLASSGFKGERVVASKGIKPRLLSTDEQQAQAERATPPHDHASGAHAHADSGMIDPHAWQSLTNGMMYAKNIGEALARADPAHARVFRDRARDYAARMQRLDDQIRQGLAAIPPAQRKVITSHDSFGYFADDYDLTFISIMGLSSEAEPSAQGFAAIIDEIKRQPGAVVFIENVTSPRLVEQIARETGAKVGGTLYSDALAKRDEPAGTYLGMFSWNAGQLMYALSP